MNPGSSGLTLPPPANPRSADLVAFSSATAPTASPSAAPVKLSSAVPFSKTAAVTAPQPSAAPVKLSSAVPVSKTAAVTAPSSSAAPVRRTSAEHAVLTSAVPSKEKPEIESHPSEARALGRQVSMGSNILTNDKCTYTVKKGSRVSRLQPGCHSPNSPWAGIIQL
jgi:hypothetical protein